MPRPKGSSNGLLLMSAILGSGSTLWQKHSYIWLKGLLIAKTILLLVKPDKRNKI